MNREIKFRVWHGSRLQYQDNFKDFGNDDDIKELSFDIDPWDESTGILMQYTGVKDKNGKEIYEGDIIFVPDEYPQSELEPAEPFNFFGEIQFKDGSFGVAWVDDKYAHSKYPRETDMWVSFPEFNSEILELKELEVIGNIFENKDLLEKSF